MPQQRQLWLGADGSGRILETVGTPTFVTPADQAAWVAHGSPAISTAPSDTTFVFVIPRRWSAKKKCATARRKEQVWRDVRVLDADDLEAWLQEAPATHVWFSRILGVMPAGVSWLPQTSAALDARLVYDAEETEHAMV